MESSENVKFRPPRRHYFINRRYQGRFIAGLCSLAVLLAAGAGCVVYVVIENALADAMYHSHMRTGELWQVIGPPLARINLALAGVSFVAAAAAVLLIARRGSGALRAMEAEIASLDAPGATDAGPVRGALWLDVRRIAHDGLRSRLHPFAEAGEQLDRAVARCARVLTTDGRFDTRTLTDELARAINRIQEDCRRFQ